MQPPLVIKDWNDGIAGSPHEGFGLIRNGDTEAFPRALIVGKKPTTLFHTAYSNTFTANAGTDVMTTPSGSLPITGIPVILTTTGTLPAGLTTGTIYYVINASATTFKLATNSDNAFTGTAIDITDTGTGTHTVTTVDPGTITHVIQDAKTSTKVKYFQDSNGRVWYRSQSNTGTFLLAGNTLTNSAGNGIAVFHTSDDSDTYLFAFRNASIDVVKVTAASNRNAPTWSNSWKSLNSGSTSGNSHHAIVGQDNIIYFCDGRYVGSIQENAGSVFDPASAGTYTYNSQALDLPKFEIAQYLEEQGVNLLIGCNLSPNIYPWDRVSDSFNIPLQAPEAGIKKMKNIGGIVYILAGTKGNIYQTPGTYIKAFASIPAYVSNNSQTLQATVVTWGGIAAMNGALLVGAGVLTSGNSGVYLIQPDGRIVIDNVPSTGSGNATSLFADNEYYTIGYASGADVIGTTRYSSFETVAQSALYRVATKTTKAKYSTLEVQVASPVATGNIRVSYRTSTTAAFTTIDTFVADGASTSFRNLSIGLTDIENIQVQVEMDGDFQLIEVRLIP
jgi:hypothetical protein